MKSLWIVVASLVLATMVAGVKMAAEQGVPLGKILFYRCLISTVITYLFLRWWGITLATPNWRAHLRRTTFGIGALASYFSAITLLPLATAVTLNYTSPLFVALFLILVARDRVRFLTLVALALGLAGVGLLLRPAFAPQQYLGIALALASAVLAAGSFMSMRILGALGETPGRTLFYFTLFATLILFPWFLASNPLQSLSGDQILLILMIGISATLGQLLMTVAFQQGDPLVSSALGYTQVIFAALLGIAIWGDSIPPAAWLGIAAIVVSGMLTLFSQARTPTATSKGTRRTRQTGKDAT